MQIFVLKYPPTTVVVVALAECLGLEIVGNLRQIFLGQ
jgi:hypothetical protein